MKNKPIRKKEEIAKNNDQKIDEDFKGFPYGQAKKEVISPKTKNEHEVADTDNKDAEKRTYADKETDEQDSDGSANAFEDK